MRCATSFETISATYSGEKRPSLAAFARAYARAAIDGGGAGGPEAFQLRRAESAAHAKVRWLQREDGGT